MKKIMIVMTALLDLARMVKSQPNEKAKIETMRKSVSEKLNEAGPKDVLHICDEITIAGFSSRSDSVEPDGKGGTVWVLERSRIYCDCFFQLLHILEKTKLAKEKYLCRRVLDKGLNLSVLISFCRALKLNQPLPNLLSYEGRNTAAQLLGPKMPELTEYILGLGKQAKELEGKNQYKEGEKKREIAKKLNGIYEKMSKFVLPWLERKEPSTITLGKSLEEKEEGNLATPAPKIALGENTGKTGGLETITEIVVGALDETSHKKKASRKKAPPKKK